MNSYIEKAVGVAAKTPTNKFESSNGYKSPDGYKGLAAFHKYWGKKPVEILSFLIESLSKENELVVDPFVGSGLIAREALLRNRRFVGIDINPVAVELTKLFIELPNPLALKEGIEDVERLVKERIDSTYELNDGLIGTHYLWDKDCLQSVWLLKKGKGGRDERTPSDFDFALIEKYQSYQTKCPRPLNQFHNSRINTTCELSLNDLFTRRALHNIDLILEAIEKQPVNIQRALKLSLTSASGQMSQMVFAITGRGKTTGKVSEKIEVGSWVIGYWRPKLHFEINVWNCFYKRATGLLKAVSGKDIDFRRFSNDSNVKNVALHKSDYSIVNDDARNVLDTLPAESVSLIITDPPHSDRIPYLEMSDMWNSILNIKPDYVREIVVSDAKGRNKKQAVYVVEMLALIKKATRVLKAGSFLALLFNARDEESWEFLQIINRDAKDLNFYGCFPMFYSAMSVVQDNRKGSLKNDYVLLFRKEGGKHKLDDLLTSLKGLPQWSFEYPNRVSKSSKDRLTNEK